jgi:integrase/recombinase XerD
MKTPTLSWQDAASAFLDRRRLDGRAASTLKNDRRALARLGRFLGWKSPREVEKQDFERYLEHLKPRVNRATQRLYLFAAMTFFRSLAERHDILVSPAATYEPPRKAPTPLGRVLTRDEVGRLLASPDVLWPVGIRDRAMLEVLYAAGLRAIELRRAKAADVDLASKQLTVRLGKGGKDRVVPLTTEAVKWLSRYVADVRPRFSEYEPGVEELFVSRWGRAFSQQMLLVKVQRIAKAAGVPVSCHVLRRTMATHLLQGGASPSAVAGILGHSDLKSLSRYCARLGIELKKAHARTHPREDDHD